MAVRIVYGDVYSLLLEWLPAQRRPFLVVPNVTAARLLEGRLASEGRGHLARNLSSGRVGRLAAELVGPGEDISTIDLVIEREILRGLLPAEYKPFGAQDPFMDQVVRELDDLRRNCPFDAEVTPESLLDGASISPHERQAFAAALGLMQAERDSVAALRQSGLYLGADLVGLATARLRAGTSAPWSGVAVAAVHRLDSVSRELLLALAQVVDVVFFPGPGSVHVRSIVRSWRLPEIEESERHDEVNPLARKYLLSEGTLRDSADAPAVEAFPDRDREVRGVIRSVLTCIERGTASWQCLVAAPRADRYAEAVAVACSEFGIAYHVGGLRFFSSLPIDRLAQSILRYLTAAPSEEGQLLGEVLTRSGCGFVPFRASALRDRLGAKARVVEDWVSGATEADWPQDQIDRLRKLLEVLAAERRDWQAPRPAAEWLRRLTGVVTEVGSIGILGRDLAWRARQGFDAELAWEGQGSRRYLDRLASFGQALAAGSRLPTLSWQRMAPEDFVRLYTGEVSFGSYLPAETDAAAIRFVDIEDVLLRDVEHLWMIDFVEGSLPLEYPKPFLIPERMREHLAMSSGILTRDRHLLLQRTNFEKVFPVPRHSLRFTYPYQDERAHTRLPSPLALTYNLLSGAEVETVIARRRQAHEFFPRVPAERPTEREAVGLAALMLNSPDPAVGESDGAALAGTIRGICSAVPSAVEAVLAQATLFLHPPAVVDLRDSELAPGALPDPMTVDQLVDVARCPFRVYARSLLRLFPSRRERWPEEPLRAVDRVLAELLLPDTWKQILAAAGPMRLRFFREAAQRAVTGDDTVATRGFQEYVARQACDYTSRLFFASGTSGAARRPSQKGGVVRAKIGQLTVEGLLSRIDEVADRRLAIMHLASPAAVENIWNGAFLPDGPEKGGDPRPAVVALGAGDVQSVELHSLTLGNSARQRLHEVATIDRAREVEPPGEWDPKVRHLGPRFDRAAKESVKAALDMVIRLVEGRRIEVKPQDGACGSCGFGPLCQRRRLPFPEGEGMN